MFPCLFPCFRFVFLKLYAIDCNSVFISEGPWKFKGGDTFKFPVLDKSHRFLRYFDALRVSSATPRPQPVEGFLFKVFLRRDELT